MTVFAIADLHLLGGDDKPMEVFGAQWAGHFDKICAAWRDAVAPGDVVLLPGDLTWAMTLDAARDDLARVGNLPGRKALLRGNHDYWWSAIGRVRESLAEGTYAVQNDSLLLDGVLIAGTRGWLLPQEDTGADDLKIYRRECMRMEMALRHARARSESAPLVVMTHYPPLSRDGRDTELTELIERFGASVAVYGHLHGPGARFAFEGVKNGVEYRLVACDHLDFAPAPVFRAE